jgi:hypothetical protein
MSDQGLFGEADWMCGLDRERASLATLEHDTKNGKDNNKRFRAHSGQDQEQRSVRVVVGWPGMHGSTETNLPSFCFLTKSSLKDKTGDGFFSEMNTNVVRAVISGGGSGLLVLLDQCTFMISVLLIMLFWCFCVIYRRSLSSSCVP